MSDYEINALNDWIKQGGTLIAHNRSSRFIASQESLGECKTTSRCPRSKA